MKSDALGHENPFVDAYFDSLASWDENHPTVEQVRLSVEEARSIHDHLAERQSQLRVYRGSHSILRERLCLHFQIPGDVSSFSRPDCFLFPKGHHLFFGGSLTFSCCKKTAEWQRRRTADNFCKVNLNSRDSHFGLLTSGRFFATFSRGSKLVDCIGVDCTSNDSSWSAFLAAIAAATTSSSALSSTFPDQDAHYWESLTIGGISSRRLTKADWLSIGWANAFKLLVRSVGLELDALRASFRDCPDVARLPLIIQTFLHFSLDDGETVFSAFQKFRSDREDTAAYFFDLLDAWESIDDATLVQCLERFETARLIIAIDQSSSDRTLCGKALTWFDLYERASRSIMIDKDSFPDSFSPIDYWHRFPHNFLLNFDHLIDGDDIPALSDDMLSPDGPSLPMAEDAQQALASADALFEEAVANKQWTTALE